MSPRANRDCERPSMFVIEDQLHCDWIGEYPDRASAVAELKRLAETAWDRAPNQAPCTSWQSCGRQYALIEYDTATDPWTRIETIQALEVSRDEVRWLM